ncbi:DUF6318 family protein [Thalassiella azotivora]
MALAGGLVLAGCGDEEPVDDPTSAPTASETASAEPSVAPPTLPSEAATESDTGAGDFTRHWFALLTHSYATGDTAALREASHPDCGTCSNLIAEIRSTVDAGQRYQGGAVTVVDALSPPLDGVSPVDVSTRTSQQALTVVNSDGSVIETEPAEELRLIVRLEWTADGWVVRAIADADALEDR